MAEEKKAGRVVIEVAAETDKYEKQMKDVKRQAIDAQRAHERAHAKTSKTASTGKTVMKNLSIEIGKFLALSATMTIAMSLMYKRWTSGIVSGTAAVIDSGGETVSVLKRVKQSLAAVGQTRLGDLFGNIGSQVKQLGTAIRSFGQVAGKLGMNAVQKTMSGFVTAIGHSRRALAAFATDLRVLPKLLLNLNDPMVRALGRTHVAARIKQLRGLFSGLGDAAVSMGARVGQAFAGLGTRFGLGLAKMGNAVRPALQSIQSRTAVTAAQMGASVVSVFSRFSAGAAKFVSKASVVTQFLRGPFYKVFMTSARVTKKLFFGLDDLAVMGFGMLGNALVKVGQKMEEMNPILNGAGKGFKALGKGVHFVHSWLLKLMNIMHRFYVGSILNIGIFTATATTMAAKFDASFARVVTLLKDEAPEALNALSNSVLKLAADTGIAARDINDTLYQTLSAMPQLAKDTAGAMDIVRVASQSAATGFVDSKTAVDTITRFLNAYGMEATRAEEISDKLFATQDLGVTTFGQIGQAIGPVIGLAAALGVKYTDLLGVIATNTPFVETSETITGLSSALEGILDKTPEAEQVARDLGLEFNVTALRAQGLVRFLREVAVATGGQPELITKLFGRKEAVQLIVNLSNNLETLREKTDAIAEAENVLAENLAITTDTAGHQWRELKAKFGSAMTWIGKPFAEAWTAVLKATNHSLESTNEMLRTWGGIWAADNPLKAFMDGYRRDMDSFKKEWRQYWRELLTTEYSEGEVGMATLGLGGGADWMRGRTPADLLGLDFSEPEQKVQALDLDWLDDLWTDRLDELKAKLTDEQRNWAHQLAQSGLMSYEQAIKAISLNIAPPPTPDLKVMLDVEYDLPKSRTEYVQEVKKKIDDTTDYVVERLLRDAEEGKIGLSLDATYYTQLDVNKARAEYEEAVAEVGRMEQAVREATAEAEKPQTKRKRIAAEGRKLELQEELKQARRDRTDAETALAEAKREQVRAIRESQTARPIETPEIGAAYDPEEIAAEMQEEIDKALAYVNWQFVQDEDIEAHEDRLRQATQAMNQFVLDGLRKAIDSGRIMASEAGPILSLLDRTYEDAARQAEQQLEELGQPQELAREFQLNVYDVPPELQPLLQELGRVEGELKQLDELEKQLTGTAREGAVVRRSVKMEERRALQEQIRLTRDFLPAIQELGAGLTSFLDDIPEEARRKATEIVQNVLPELSTLQAAEFDLKLAEVSGAPDDEVERLKTRVEDQREIVREAIADIIRELAKLDGMETGPLSELLSSLTAMSEALDAPGDETDKWQDKMKSIASTVEGVTRGILSAGRAMGILNDETEQVLSGIVDIAAGVGRIAEGDFIGGAAQAIGGLAGVFGGLFGESPEEKAAREALEENTRALRQLSEDLEKQRQVALGLSGTQAETVEQARAAFGGSERVQRLSELRATAADPDASWQERFVANVEYSRERERAVRDFEKFMEEMGWTIADANDWLDSIGITDVDFVEGAGFNEWAESVVQAQQALEEIQLKDIFETWAGEMDRLQQRFELFDVDTPVEKLKMLYESFSAASGLDVPQFDLDTAEGRKAFEDWMLSVFEQLERGDLTFEQLGGMDATELLDAFGDMEGLIDEIDEVGESDSFQAFRGITEVTANRIAGLLTTDVYWNQMTAENVVEMVKLLGGLPITGEDIQPPYGQPTQPEEPGEDAEPYDPNEEPRPKPTEPLDEPYVPPRYAPIDPTMPAQLTVEQAPQVTMNESLTSLVEQLNVNVTTSSAVDAEELADRIVRKANRQLGDQLLQIQRSRGSAFTRRVR